MSDPQPKGDETIQSAVVAGPPRLRRPQSITRKNAGGIRLFWG